MKWFLVIVIFLTSAFLDAEDLLFRSNSIGLALEGIAPFRSDNFEYVLQISEDSESGMLVKTLMHNGKEFKKWVELQEETGRSITLYEEGVIQEKNVYSAENLIHTIQYYGEDGIVTEEHVYVYDSGDLDHVLVVDQNGEEMYRVNYERGKNGRLRKMKRIYPEKTTESLYVSGMDGVAEEWHGRGDKGDLFRFGPDHQVQVQEYWEGMNLTSAIDYGYNQGDLDYSIERNFSTNVITETWFNDRGLQKKVLSKNDNVLVSESDFVYDENDNVLEKRIWTPGLRELWEYTYTNEDKLDTEMYYKNGTIISKIQYIDDTEYHEFLYRQGKQFIKIMYRNDSKVDETLLIAPGDR